MVSQEYPGITILDEVSSVAGEVPRQAWHEHKPQVKGWKYRLLASSSCLLPRLGNTNYNANSGFIQVVLTTKHARTNDN